MAIIAGLLVTSLVGAICELVSTEVIILKEIIHGYKLLPFKFFARYFDEEPEYLKVIK